MQFLRKNDGSGDILDHDGTLIARLIPSKAADEAYAVVEERIRQALDQDRPRILLSLRDGLLEDAQADIPCQVLILEEDRFAAPPLVIRRRDIVTPEPDGVTKTLEAAEKKQAKYLD